MRRVDGVGPRSSTYRDILISFVLRNSFGASRYLCISSQLCESYECNAKSNVGTHFVKYNLYDVSVCEIRN